MIKIKKTRDLTACEFRTKNNLNTLLVDIKNNPKDWRSEKLINTINSAYLNFRLAVCITYLSVFLDILLFICPPNDKILHKQRPLPVSK